MQKADQQSLDEFRHDAEKLAAPMFAVTLLFMVLLAALIVAWIDIPRVAEMAMLETGEEAPTPEMLRSQADAMATMVKAAQIGEWILRALLMIWPLYLAEFIYNTWTSRPRSLSKKRLLAGLLVCVAPPLRLAAPSAARDQQIWLPRYGWRYPSRALTEALSRMFSKPMLIIALLILPVLLIEFGLRGLVEQHYWLRLLLHICTGMIWCAFSIEFIIMFSASKKKLDYVKKHWVDLAIILLPLLSFLRSVRVLRLAKLAKVEKIAKLGRVYRLKGLGMKAMRALLLLQVVNRLLRITPEKKLLKLKHLHEEKKAELDELEETIRKLEKTIKAG